MSLNDIHDYFAKLIANGQLPAFLCGLVVGFSLISLLLRLVKRWLFAEVVKDLQSQIKKLSADLDELRVEKDALVHDRDRLKAEKKATIEEMATLEEQAERRSGEADQKIRELSAACEKITTKNADIRVRINKERKTSRNLKAMLNSYIEQLEQVANSDGKIWHKKVEGQVVPFVPLSQRQTAIISLINLKGGVGKTTLTANLGVTLATQGLRVLLIDLDHQSSLTRLCLTPKERQEVKESQRYIDNFFEGGGDFDKIRQCVTRCHNATGLGRMHVAAVHEDFETIENKLQARWLVNLLDEDLRHRLRGGLHSPRLREHYDVVLIDCPPRWSTGSINAIAASDYVLIPMLLEQLSAEAVPRILGWLKRFQSDCCPELNLLGIVGNKATNKTANPERLIARELATWTSIQDESSDAWKGPVRFFDEVIREHPPTQSRFAAEDPIHQPRYDHLVNLIRKEIPHAYLHPRTVYPSAGATAGGGRD